MQFNYSFKKTHNIDCCIDHPVAVVANYASDGRFIPAYIRFVCEDGSEQTIKVTAIKYIKDKLDRTVFCCAVVCSDQRMEVMLTYYIDNHIWVIEC